MAKANQASDSKDTKKVVAPRITNPSEVEEQPAPVPTPEDTNDDGAGAEVPEEQTPEEETPEITENGYDGEPDETVYPKAPKVSKEEQQRIAQVQQDDKLVRTVFGDNVDAQVEVQDKQRRIALARVLEKEEKVRMFIPLGLNEVAGTATQEVGLNGVVFIYPKGVYINVPKPIADLLANAHNQTVEALQQFRVDQRTEKALG